MQTETTSQVLKAIGWDEQTYSSFLYQTAEKYMDGFCPNYPQVVTQIMKSTIFWNWWKMHWQERDQQFLDCLAGAEVSPLNLYLEHHDHRTLLTAVYLSGQVLEESYADMIGEIMKAQTRKEVSC